MGRASVLRLVNSVLIADDRTSNEVREESLKGKLLSEVDKAEDAVRTHTHRELIADRLQLDQIVEQQKRSALAEVEWTYLELTQEHKQSFQRSGRRN